MGPTTLKDHPMGTVLSGSTVLEGGKWNTYVVRVGESQQVPSFTKNGEPFFPSSSTLRPNGDSEFYLVGGPTFA